MAVSFSAAKYIETTDTITGEHSLALSYKNRNLDFMGVLKPQQRTFQKIKDECPT
jgi:hypothetical protein